MCHPDGTFLGDHGTPAGAEEHLRLPSGDEMPAYVVGDPGAAGVLVIHDIFGTSRFYEGLCDQLAEAGYFAVLPDCFFREGPLAEMTLPASHARYARFDEQRTLRELSYVLDWLKDTGHAGDSERIGTIGFCMGGTIGLDLAAERSDLATVCYYGFPAAVRRTHERSAPPPLNLVDHISGPIIGFWGALDEPVGMDNVERLERELVGRGVQFECVIYPGVVHAFMGAPTVDTSAADSVAAADSWQRTLAFLSTSLAPVPRAR